MLDQGDWAVKAVEIIVGALFSGLPNSCINAARLMCYLNNFLECLTETQ